MKVELVNKKTGEIKAIEVGLSIWIFIFGCIPLLFRRMWGWGLGLMFLTLAATQDSTNMDSTEEMGLMVIMAAFIVLYVYLSVNGNRLYAIKLINEGWIFRDPNSESAATARNKWNLEKL